MTISIQQLTAVPATRSVQLASYGTTLGLYAAGEPTPVSSGSFQTVLSAYAVGTDAPQPANLTLPALLPTPLCWSLQLTAANTGQVASSQFGGGWNVLSVDTIAGGTQAPSYSYTVEDTTDPSFLLNSSSSPAQQQFVCALFSGYQLGLIGLQEQDGQQVPHVSGIVGTEDAPVAGGRVFGDLSSGLPATVTTVYQTNKLVGPLAPSGAFCGSLSLASYDINNDTLGTPVALLPGIEVCDFDMAVSAAGLCLLAVTGTGAPLIALFSPTGQALDTPAIPAGSWSNPGHWVTSPTVVPTPGSATQFSFAFSEMSDQAPVAVYSGTATVPTPTP